VSMENYCENNGGLGGGGLDGSDSGMAPYLPVPSTRFLIPNYVFSQFRGFFLLGCTRGGSPGIFG
jgi:hypothetical protein